MDLYNINSSDTSNEHANPYFYKTNYQLKFKRN